MARYPNHQLEAATNVLKSFGIAEPYTLEDKIKAIKAVTTLKSNKVEKILKNSLSFKDKISYPSPKENVSYNTDIDWSDRELFTTNPHPGKLCLVDWRDDLENVIWI